VTYIELGMADSIRAPRLNLVDNDQR